MYKFIHQQNTLTPARRRRHITYPAPVDDVGDIEQFDIRRQHFPAVNQLHLRRGKGGRNGRVVVTAPSGQITSAAAIGRRHAPFYDCNPASRLPARYDTGPEGRGGLEAVCRAGA